LVIDDMSNPSAEIVLPPSHTGDEPGYWYTYIGGGAGPNDTGSITPLAQSEIDDGGESRFQYAAIGENAGGDAGIAPPPDAGAIARAACASGVTPAAQYAYAAEGFNFELSPSGGAQYVDASSYAGIQFWVYNAIGAPSTVQVQIPDKESDPNGGVCGTAADGSTVDACSSVYIDLLVAPGWSFQQLPFRYFESAQGYGYPQPLGGDMTTAIGVNFQVNQPNAPEAGEGGVAFDFCVADIAFYE
jgi:hypothetical protein